MTDADETAPQKPQPAAPTAAQTEHVARLVVTVSNHALQVANLAAGLGVPPLYTAVDIATSILRTIVEQTPMERLVGDQQARNLLKGAKAALRAFDLEAKHGLHLATEDDLRVLRRNGPNPSMKG